MELCYVKTKRFKKWQDTPCDILLKEEFRKLGNKITAKIRLAKNRYTVKQFALCHRNVRKTWKLVIEVTGRPVRSNVDKILKMAFPDVPPTVTANGFNEHFINSISNLHNQSKPPMLQCYMYNDHSACMPSVTEEELWQIMRTFSITKSAGYDGVRMRDLLHNFNKLKVVLLHIINQTLQTGLIHNHMKISIVRPLHKQKSKKITIVIGQSQFFRL